MGLKARREKPLGAGPLPKSQSKRLLLEGPGTSRKPAQRRVTGGSEFHETTTTTQSLTSRAALTKLPGILIR